MTGSPSHLYTGRNSEPPKTLCGASRTMGDTWTAVPILVTCTGCLSAMDAARGAPRGSEGLPDTTTTHSERNHP